MSEPERDNSAGERLAALRAKSGLTLTEVTARSEKIAAALGQRACRVLPSRLCEIERKGRVPSIHKLYSLSLIYERPISVLLAFYGLYQRGSGGELALIESAVDEALRRNGKPWDETGEMKERRDHRTPRAPRAEPES